MPHVELVTDIAAPIERVFAICLDVDLHQHSQERAGERAVAGVRTGMIGEGQTVTWRARHFGVPWRMTSLITDVSAPYRFTDVQVRGPFGHWRHEHLLTPHGTGTRMRDVVTWSAPFGPLGRLVERAGLARYMTGLLDERNALLKRVCEHDDGRYGQPVR